MYRNIYNEQLQLSMDICTARNLTLLHTVMAGQFWEKPSNKPSAEAMLKPIWSTWALYKKNINESSLMQFTDR